MIPDTRYPIPDTNFAFFGTDEFSVIVLDELKKAGFLPALVVTATDKKMGRGMRLTPPPAKLWAEKNNIPFLQPEKLGDSFYYTLSPIPYTLFVVASYGKIIPAQFLRLPKHGSLNVHPSLLPLYRGPSPIEQQILDGAKEVGVTIMQMDEEMDHGPILAQRKLDEALWETLARTGLATQGPSLPRVFHSMTSSELHDILAHLGGELLAETIPQWLAGEIMPQEQEHEKATYTKKITKEDGLLELDGDPELNYRKFLAYTPWPGSYFFTEVSAETRGTNAEKRRKKLRVKITDAELRDGTFVIKKIIPEGRQEMDYEGFLRAHK